MIDTWADVADASVVDTPGRVTCAQHDTTSLLIVNDNGRVRVFHNVCQHRGHPLRDARSMGEDTDGLVCPLHGWRYGLDGKLLRVPGAKHFAGSGIDELQLSEVPSRIEDGRVLVQLAKQQKAD